MSARSRKAVKAAEPILDECDECNGTGQCQQQCENCREPLTTANWSTKSECYACNQCVLEDNPVPHPYGGYSHCGCRCKGCAS
jgi:hypothetical protein